jgi:hypothetical protein
MSHSFAVEWVEVATLGLGTKQLKGGDIFRLDEYQDCILELRTIKKIPKERLAILNDISDGTWLKTAPRDENELELTGFYDGHHTKKEVALLAKNTAIKALLADKWKMFTMSGKGSKSGSAAKLTCEQLAFAAAWRRATIQAGIKNIELKWQVFTFMCQFDKAVEGIPSSLEAWERVREIILAAMKVTATPFFESVKECCAEMETTYEQMSREHNGNGRSKSAGQDATNKMRGISDDDDDMSLGEDEDQEVNWRKEMRKQVDACIQMGKELEAIKWMWEITITRQKKKKGSLKKKV